MKLSFSKNIARRGAGFGNEIFPMCKSYLASKAIDGVLVPHSWSLNPRKYGKHLGYPGDFIPPAILPKLPYCHRLTYEHWNEIKIPNYKQFVETQINESISRKEPMIVQSEGMWGGYLAIDDAKIWLREKIQEIDGVEDVISEIKSSIDGAIRVAVHVRMGDFLDGCIVKPGAFNVRYPFSWYRFVMSEIGRILNNECVFYLFGDATIADFDELLDFDQFQVVYRHRKNDFCDLVAASNCDLVVCSVSSFSMLASWLGGIPYIWNADQLRSKDGYYYIWETEDWMDQLWSETFAEGELGAGLPVSEKLGFDDSKLKRLIRGEYSRIWSSDLMRYGRIGVSE